MSFAVVLGSVGTTVEEKWWRIGLVFASGKHRDADQKVPSRRDDGNG